MNDREDIERALRSFEHEVEPATRRSILAAYRASANHERRPLPRRVPLFAAAAAVLVATALAFLGGWLVAARGLPDGRETSGIQQHLTWSAAEEDLL